MFDFFKKKPAPAPEPKAVETEMSGQIKRQMDIAELQSKISELRRQAAQTNADIAKKNEERAGLMAQIQAAPQSQKTVFALRVRNIDKFVAGLTNNLALVEQQIGNIEAYILQMNGTGVVEVGDVGQVVNAEEHQAKLQETIDKKNVGDTNAAISSDMFNELTGSVTSDSSELSDIIAEAEGVAHTPMPSSPVLPAESDQPLPGMPMSQC